jgi:hypothetical protein
MKIFDAVFIVMALAMFSLASAAHAGPIPEYMLQKDYENCLGGQTPQQDPERAQYCSCIRNGMRGWSEETYAALLIEQARTQTLPPQIEALGKACVEKVMH